MEWIVLQLSMGLAAVVFNKRLSEFNIWAQNKFFGAKYGIKEMPIFRIMFSIVGLVLAVGAALRLLPYLT